MWGCYVFSVLMCRKGVADAFHSPLKQSPHTPPRRVGLASMKCERGHKTRTLIIVCGEIWGSFSLGYLSHLNEDDNRTWYCATFTKNLLWAFHPLCHWHQKSQCREFPPSHKTVWCFSMFGLWWLSSSDILLCLLCNRVATRKRGTLEFFFKVSQSNMPWHPAKPVWRQTEFKVQLSGNPQQVHIRGSFLC